MKSAFASIAAVAFLVSGVFAQDDLSLNTPNPPTQCVNTQITWTGGQAPFFLSVTPGGQPTAAALEQFPNLTASPFVWTPNLPAGTSVGFSITDATGTTKQSAPVTIQSGPLDSCLSSTQAGQTSGAATSSGGAIATTSGSGTSTSGSPSGSATSPSGSSPSSTSGSPSGSSVSTSPSPSTSGGSNSGALANMAPMGVAGIVGAIIAAVIA